jgi:hypothetical protein
MDKTPRPQTEHFTKHNTKQETSTCGYWGYMRKLGVVEMLPASVNKDN